MDKLNLPNDPRITEKVKMAIAFAIAAHEAGPVANRVRKYDGKRYYTHPIAVMLILLFHVPNITEDQLIAAILHDVLEDVYAGDVDAGFAAIELLFGTVVANMVLDLTDVFTHEAYPDMNRAARKAAEADRLSRIPVLSKTVKLADLIHNTSSIVKALEQGKDGFAYKYMHEKEVLLVALADGDAALHVMASKAVTDFFATHGRKPKKKNVEG